MRGCESDEMMRRREAGGWRGTRKREGQREGQGERESAVLCYCIVVREVLLRYCYVIGRFACFGSGPWLAWLSA